MYGNIFGSATRPWTPCPTRCVRFQPIRFLLHSVFTSLRVEEFAVIILRTRITLRSRIGFHKNALLQCARPRGNKSCNSNHKPQQGRKRVTPANGLGRSRKCSQYARRYHVGHTRML
jgi:hypothetical protein